MSVSFVYLVQAQTSKRLKIGKADDVTKRLSSLRTGSPEPLQLLYAIRIREDSQAAARHRATQLEKRLHKRFELFRLHGEWFHYRPAIVDEFHRMSTQWISQIKESK